MKKTNWFGVIWLVVGYLFLYLPILFLIVMSFNDTKSVTVFSGFSFRWYVSLAEDDDLIKAALLSFRLAALTACGAVVMGTFCAYVLNQYRRFFGRSLFTAMVNAPLVMPEVIIGLSLLLTFVTFQNVFGFPEKGIFTIWVGHTLLGTAYATVVILSRLKEMDKSLVEAAMDLGCKPHQVFRLVTLPNLIPALAAAWLLTFSLSLDDVVLAQFLSGPGSTTLPSLVFSRARLNLSPEINAVATITVAVVAIVVLGCSFYMARAERLRQRQIQRALANQ